MLLFEIGVLCIYFGGMSVLMLLGPVFKNPIFLIGWVIHVTVATLCFVSFVGVILCFAGIVLRKYFVKWLLITLSVLGIFSLPIAIHNGTDDVPILKWLCYLAGWSVVLLINTLIVFYYMDLRNSKI